MENIYQIKISKNFVFTYIGTDAYFSNVQLNMR